MFTVFAGETYVAVTVAIKAVSAAARLTKTLILPDLDWKQGKLAASSVSAVHENLHASKADAIS